MADVRDYEWAEEVRGLIPAIGDHAFRRIGDQFGTRFKDQNNVTGSVSQSVSELPLLGVGEVGPCASLCASSAPNKDPRREGDVIMVNVACHQI